MTCLSLLARKEDPDGVLRGVLFSVRDSEHVRILHLPDKCKLTCNTTNKGKNDVQWKVAEIN